MPDERVIEDIENIFAEIIDLGGQRERTSIVPNMLVRDAAPTGLDDYIIIADDRDEDNILALTVPGVIYSDNDLVNVIFPKGGEAIAFQQGSQSASSGLWAKVPGTSTDIFFNQGDVGIGKSVAPDARLEVLDTAQAQLRLSHTEDTKFADFTVDTNHDLTIKPSSTGQVILQPTSDSVDFFQVLDADGGTPIINVDSTNEALSVKTETNSYTSEGLSIQTHFYIETDNASSVRTAAFARQSDSAFRGAQNAFVRASAAGGAVSDTWRIGQFIFEGHDGTDFNQGAAIRAVVDGAVAANTVPMSLVFETSETNSAGLTERFVIAADGTISANGDFVANSDVLLAGGNQDFEVSSRANALTLSGQTAATSAFLEIYSADGDGTDNAGLIIYGVGTRTAIVNRERMLMRYDSSQQFEVFVEADGSGTLRPLVLYTEGNTDQLHLDSSGNIGLSVVPSTRLDVGAGAIELEEMTAPGGGAANTLRLYAVDNGAGKTQLAVIFNTGAAQILATQV